MNKGIQFYQNIFKKLRTRKMHFIFYFTIGTIFGKISRFDLLQNHHLQEKSVSHTGKDRIFQFCSRRTCQKCLEVFEFGGLDQVKRVCRHMLSKNGCCAQFYFVPLGTKFWNKILKTNLLLRDQNDLGKFEKFLRKKNFSRKHLLT